METNNSIKMSSTEKRMYLKRTRKEFGMSQKQFANILGLKYGTYRKYEELNSGSRNVSDKLLEDIITKVTQYEQEHKSEIVGKIIISRYLEVNKDTFLMYFPSKAEREIVNIMFRIILDRIKDIEKRAKVPYLMVQK